MAIFLGIASQKGGVGKTTVAVNLGYALSKRGWKILLVDADMQGGLGFSLTEKAKNNYGFFDVLLNPGWEKSMSRFPVGTCMNQMDLITRGTGDNASRALEGMDGEWSSLSSLHSCREAMESLEHDVIIFDTGAAPSRLGMNLLAMMDSILAVQEPDFLSMRSLPQLLRMFHCLPKKTEDEEGPDVAGILFSKTEESTSDIEKEFRELLPEELPLKNSIPRHPEMLEATKIGVPVGMLDESSQSPARNFDRLAEELEPRLGLCAFSDKVRSSQ